MSRRFGIIGCRPPCKDSPTYERDMATYEVIRAAVVEHVQSLPDDCVVVSGMDSIAAETARARGLEVVEHLPDYDRHGGKMAPLVRNILIVDDSDEITAFPAPWSTGTWHAIGVARDKGKTLCVKKYT